LVVRLGVQLASKKFQDRTKEFDPGSD